MLCYTFFFFKKSCKHCAIACIAITNVSRYKFFKKLVDGSIHAARDWHQKKLEQINNINKVKTKTPSFGLAPNVILRQTSDFLVTSARRAVINPKIHVSSRELCFYNKKYYKN